MTEHHWYNNGPKEGLYYEVVSTLGHRLNTATGDSATALVNLLNYYEQRLVMLQSSLDKATEVIERVLTEYPLVVQPCLCGKDAACPSCEITHVLSEWQAEAVLSDQ